MTSTWALCLLLGVGSNGVSVTTTAISSLPGGSSSRSAKAMVSTWVRCVVWFPLALTPPTSDGPTYSVDWLSGSTPTSSQRSVYERLVELIEVAPVDVVVDGDVCVRGVPLDRELEVLDHGPCDDCHGVLL